MLGRSKGNVSTTVKNRTDKYIEYQETPINVQKAVLSCSRRGNSNSKKMRVPNIQRVYHKVRYFVRLKRSKLECTRSKEVLQFLLSKKYLELRIEGS